MPRLVPLGNTPPQSGKVLALLAAGASIGLAVIASFLINNSHQARLDSSESARRAERQAAQEASAIELLYWKVEHEAPSGTREILEHAAHFGNIRHTAPPDAQLWLFKHGLVRSKRIPGSAGYTHPLTDDGWKVVKQMFQAAPA